jgi:hypothetical protein
MILNSLMLLVFIAGAASSPGFEPTRTFDEFGDIKCEDEMARLDNFAIQLQNEPQAKGVIVFYGGKTFRGRLPKRGEAEARAARLKPYLVNRRGIPNDQVVVVNGGYATEWRVTLWIVPQGAGLPTGSESIPVEQIKFRKGKVNPRDYRCGI